MTFSIVIAILVSYFLGNLNGSVTISNLMVHDDVRHHGSGNAGLTNFFRSFGGWNSLLVILIDVGKAVLACLTAGLLLEPYGYYMEGLMLGGVCVSLGHDFPALLGFHGGKGILCGISLTAVIDWQLALLVFVAFVLVFVLTHYVSLCSILGAVILGVGFMIRYFEPHPFVAVGGAALALLAIVMHRENIVRLVKGTESKVFLHKKGKKS